MSVRKIANRLKISASTVSLALRGDAKISKRTRRLVQAEAERIGYRRDAKLNELMTQLRHSGARPAASCIGLLSFDEGNRPWEDSERGRALYQVLAQRAEFLGYRLEVFRLGQAGMTEARMRSILDTRKIEGLLCFGEEGMGQAFPSALLGGCVVSLGLGFSTALHSVSPDYFADMAAAYERLLAAGKRRIGLVMGSGLPSPVASRYQAAFLERDCALGTGEMPVLRVDDAGGRALAEWLNRKQLDAVLYVGGSDLAEWRRVTTACQNEEATLATLNLAWEEGEGVFTDVGELGRRAVELLVRCIGERDLGLPEHPKCESVLGKWQGSGSMIAAKQTAAKSESSRSTPEPALL